MRKPTVVVVLGYGCHLTEGMKKYLDGVLSFTNKNKVNVVITTGGYTNRKSAPEVSEARVMADYLRSRGIEAPVFLEEKARTTIENLKGVELMILQDRIEWGKFVIFCDRARALKVSILARLILLRWPKLKTYDLTRSFKKTLKQIFIATPLDILSLWVPYLYEREIQRRERMMDRS